MGNGSGTKLSIGIARSKIYIRYFRPLTSFLGVLKRHKVQMIVLKIMRIHASLSVSWFDTLYWAFFTKFGIMAAKSTLGYLLKNDKILVLKEFLMKICKIFVFCKFFFLRNKKNKGRCQRLVANESLGSHIIKTKFSFIFL